MKGQLLIVDDDEAMRDMLAASLGKRDYATITAAGMADAVEALEGQPIDAVVTDLRLANESGIHLCRRAAELRPDVPVVVITAFGSMDTAVAAIRGGAYDFITKPVDLEQLALSIGRAVESHQLRSEVRRLREAQRVEAPFGNLVGTSRAMRRVYDMVERVSDSDTTVLITGESGTGKELIARALHARSPRREGPFLAINCAAISESLLESELFGHKAGAFTDARDDREGLFVQSSGGTLFLDEIGEMPVGMQTKLLRALQERRVRPLGGVGEVPFDTRLLAATNRDIDELVEQGTFREDLFYRINVVRVHLPPLRSRGNDVLALAQHFVDEKSRDAQKEIHGITPDAGAKLLDYDWPGNVRELENVVERAIALTRFDQIVVEDLPDKIRQHQSQNWVVAADDPDELPTLEALERRYIRRVLEASGGNKTQTARILGVDRRTLYRKLERFEEQEPSG